MHSLFIATLLMLTFSTIAAPQPIVVESHVTNDMFVQLSCEHSVFWSIDTIDYCFLTVTNPKAIIFLPRESYFCFAELFDQKGQPIPKQGLGNGLGRDFWKLKAFSWDSVGKQAKGTRNERVDRMFVSSKGCEGRYLFKPEDVFRIKEPGLYKLRLQFQVFKQIDAKGKQEMQIVRFEPVEVMIQKE